MRRRVLIICLWLCLSILLCTGCSAQGSQKTSEYEDPAVPMYEENLESMLLHPMEEVYAEMGWSESQMEEIQITHLKVNIDPIVFHNREMQLYLTPTVLPTTDLREESAYKMYDFSCIPVPEDDEEKFLQRFAYVSYFQGEEAREDACSFMKILDDHFMSLYGEPLSDAQHAYAKYNPEEFFSEQEKDTMNVDQHFLSDTWVIREDQSSNYKMILGIVEYSEENGEITYRVSISYEWSLVYGKN